MSIFLKIVLLIFSAFIFSCAKGNHSAIETSSFSVINVKELSKVKKTEKKLRAVRLYEIRGTFPLGDVVFIDSTTLAVPYAKIRKLTEKEKEEYVKRRKEYLKKSPEELAEEVVKREKEETETSYKLRKKMAEWFFGLAKKYPSLFFKPPEEVATELGIEFIRLDKRGYSVIKKIPIISEEIPTETQCSVQSGKNLIKKPVRKCRNWLGLDIVIVSDGKNLYVTPYYYRLMEFPTVVIDKHELSVKSYLKGVKVTSSLKENLLEAYLPDEKINTIGYVREKDGKFEFIEEKKFRFRYGRSVLLGNRFLANLRLPLIYDLEKDKVIKTIYNGITEFKGDIFYIKAGIVKRVSNDLKEVKETLLLCSPFIGDMSSFCYLHRPLKNYIMFLYDRGVPARNPQTGNIYGAGNTYRAELWLLDPLKKEKFRLIDELLEYHYQHFDFISYNPENNLLVVLKLGEKITVYRID